MERSGLSRLHRSASCFEPRDQPSEGVVMPGLRAVKPIGASPQRALTSVAVAGVACAALSPCVPGSTPTATTQAGAAPAGGTIAPIPTDIHVCGADAKAMLSKFQAAIQERRGAVHEVVDLGAAQAVS